MKIKIRFLWVVLLLLVFSCASATKKMHEGDYQEPWCLAKGGQLEVRIEGGRIDCQLDYYSVEFDFASKWAEAIGQAKYYGRMTERSPGVVLILRKPSDFKHVYKLLKATQNDRFRWAVWIIWGWEEKN